MQTVEFIYDKSKRRPKKLQNNVFVLLSSERIRLQSGESKKLDMKLSILLPNRLVLACTLLPTLCEKGLKLENCRQISADNNTIKPTCKLTVEIAI